jgi:hypothetical protein
MHDLEEEKKNFSEKQQMILSIFNLTVFIANVTVLEAIEMPYSLTECFLFQLRFKKKKKLFSYFHFQYKNKILFELFKYIKYKRKRLSSNDMFMVHLIFLVYLLFEHILEED